VVEPLELPPQAARARARTAKANAVIFIVFSPGGWPPRVSALYERPLVSALLVSNVEWFRPGPTFWC
jgi:hypothetical protein